jgi:alcohol dehydrogenase class IV
LLEASAMANLACGSSGLALVHALSLSTAIDLPHGYQNGVLLPWVADFNRPATRAWVRDEIDRLRPLYERIGFEPRFTAGEIGGAAAEAMVDVALASPLSANNVCASGAGELRSLLERAGVAVGPPQA